MVEFGGHLVNGGTRKTATSIYSALVRVQAGKRGQQRRVNIQQSPFKMHHKTRREYAHETRQHQQRWLITVDCLAQHIVKRGARIGSVGKRGVIHNLRGQTHVCGDLQAACIRAVADDSGNSRIQSLFPLLLNSSAGNGRHVGAAAGNQNHDVFHASHYDDCGSLFFAFRQNRTVVLKHVLAQPQSPQRPRRIHMDLAFTPEEQAFREEVRAWVKAHLPEQLSHKVHNAQRLTRDDMQAWALILGVKGWLGYGWPKEFGGPGWNAVQKHLFEEECALAGAPRVIPFGPVMVAPVIMAFGNAEQQQRFLPGIASGKVWWSQGYSEPGSGSDLASLKTRAERVGDKFIVNGQKTWTTLGQFGEWIFCLVRTSTEGKPQTGISFLLIDMTSPGVSVRPIKLLDGECEVNEVWFDNVEVPAENLIGQENKGWDYAKYLLAHERTNIADVNRAKRELERLKRIAKTEGVFDDMRFRDEISKLEVDIIALEMMVLRVLSAEKSGKQSLDIAGLLKIRGSEIQQRYSELMMLAAGPFSLPFIYEAMDAGWQGDHVGAAHCAPLASTYFNMRKTTIYGGSNEVQRNIVAKTVLG